MSVWYRSFLFISMSSKFLNIFNINNTYTHTYTHKHLSVQIKNIEKKYQNIYSSE